MASLMTADGITALNGATVQAIDATDYQINSATHRAATGSRC